MIFRLSTRPIARLAAVLGLAMTMSAVPGVAHADGLIGGYVGTPFGGKTADSSSILWGGMIGAVRPGAGIGFVVDVGYSTDFFNTQDELGFKTSVLTLMGNIVIGGGSRRGGGVAPYLSGGVGLLRANVNDARDILTNLSTEDFGMNVGGGLNVFLGSSFGLQGDIRYFRSFTSGSGGIFDVVDLSDFDFWRATGGIVIRW